MCERDTGKRSDIREVEWVERCVWSAYPKLCHAFLLWYVLRVYGLMHYTLLLAPACWKIQQYKCKTRGFCPFSYFVPCIWNSLPKELRQGSALSSFQAKLKTFLSSQYFFPSWYQDPVFMNVIVCVCVCVHACVCDCVCVCVCMRMHVCACMFVWISHVCINSLNLLCWLLCVCVCASYNALCKLH